MDGEVSFRDYYGQFVSEEIKNEVLRFFGKETLLSSTDEHLNDIPLRKWDALTGFRFSGSTMVSRPSVLPTGLGAKLKEANEGLSPATLVCIYKEGARQVIEKLKA